MESANRFDIANLASELLEEEPQAPTGKKQGGGGRNHPNRFPQPAAGPFLPSMEEISKLKPFEARFIAEYIKASDISDTAERIEYAARMARCPELWVPMDSEPVMKVVAFHDGFSQLIGSVVADKAYVLSQAMRVYEAAMTSGSLKIAIEALGLVSNLVQEERREEAARKEKGKEQKLIIGFPVDEPKPLAIEEPKRPKKIDPTKDVDVADLVGNLDLTNDN